VPAGWFEALEKAVSDEDIIAKAKEVGEELRAEDSLPYIVQGFKSFIEYTKFFPQGKPQFGKC